MPLLTMPDLLVAEQDRVAVAGDAGALDQERRQPLGGALGPGGGDRLGAEEPGRLLAAPAEPGLDRVALRASARCRAAGSRPRGAACRGRRGRRGRRRRRAARPRSAPPPPGRAAARPRPRRCSRCRRRAPAGGRSAPARTRIRGGSSIPSGASQDLARVRSLHGEHRVAVGDVADADVEVAAPAAEPGEVGLVVGGVGDDQVAVVAKPVDEEVVDNPAVLVAEARVLGPADSILATSFESTRCRNASAPGPSTSTSPMWETSNIPACVRTAECSSRIPSYVTGISQPAKGTTFAPSSTCCSYKGVRRRSTGAGYSRWAQPAPAGPAAARRSDRKHRASGRPSLDY